jgi:hypothetical protein
MLALAFASVTARARADEPLRIRLVYEAPAACPSRAELVEPIAARVGYAPLDDAADEGFAIRVVADGTRFRGTLEPLPPLASATRSSAGPPRTFSSVSCRELVESVALTMALYLDPLLGPRPPARAPVARPNVVATPWREPDPFEKDAPEAPPPPPRSRAWFVSGAAVASVALGPALTLGPRVGVGVRGATFAVAIEGRADLPVASARARGLDVDASFVGASLVPCARRGVVFACLDAAAGRYEAVARGPDLRSVAATFFLMGGARVGADVRLDERTRITAYVAGAAPFTPVRLLVANDPVWSTGPANLGLALAASWSP